MSDKLRGGSTIGGYLALHLGNLKYFINDIFKISLDTTAPTGTTRINIDGELNIKGNKVATESYITSKISTSATSTSTTNIATSSAVKAAMDKANAAQSTANGKVTKISGKGLSANDFTDILETKLNGIATNANKTVLSNSVTSTSQSTAATSKAVKVAKDKANLGVANAATAQARANLGVTNASAAQTKANSAYTLASGKLGASSNAVSATKIKSINTSFSGVYPFLFNVNGTLYSHSDIKYTGSTGVLAIKGNKVATEAAINSRLSSSTTSRSTTAIANSAAVKAAMDKANSAFQSASNGKSVIATAITGKNVSTSATDTFSTMASNINSIQLGDHKIGDRIQFSSLGISMREIWKKEAYRLRAMTVSSSGMIYEGIDNYIRVYDTNGTQSSGGVYTHTDDITTVKVDAAGYIYSGSIDMTIKKSKLPSTTVWSFTGHTKSIEVIDIDKDSNVYSSARDTTLRKISPLGIQIWSISLSASSRAHTLAISSDNYIYAGVYDRTLRKISSAGVQIWSYKTFYNGPVFLDPDGNVYIGADKTISKISPAGVEIWTHVLTNDALSSGDHITSIYIKENGLIYVAISDWIFTMSLEGLELEMYTGSSSDSYKYLGVDKDDYLYYGSYNYIYKTQDSSIILS